MSKNNTQITKLKIGSKQHIDNLLKRPIKIRKRDRCPKCFNKAEKLHTCPYVDELYGDDTFCKCCGDCQDNCAREI
jgi:hypothetical protein